MIDANKYPKRALVVVFGTTPAVVTETIFGLAQRTPQFIPTEIHIITTLHGERIARQRLFEPETGSYWRLSGEYRLHLPKEVYIHVAGAEEPGCAIEDLRTSQQNQLSANTIGRVIETLAADPDCAMHVSLAGGRKTMSYYAGYALSIYGRVQDSLSHVLVNDPFEDVPEFEYPPFEPRMMMQRNGTQILSSNAHVDLPEVPFVRIGAALDRKLIPRGLDFSKVIERIDALLPILTGHAPIILDVKDRSLRAGTIQIRLDNQTTGFYWYLLENKELDTYTCTAAQAENLLDFMFRAAPTGIDGRIADGKFAKACKEPGLQAFVKRITKLASSINHALTEQLGQAGRHRFGVLTPQKNGKYRLSGDGKNVKILASERRSRKLHLPT